MGFRDKIKKLERLAERDVIEIPQKAGSVARFPQSAYKEAFLRNIAILRARANREEPPEPHPLSLAVRDAAHRESWHDSVFDMLGETGDIEDLSEA